MSKANVASSNLYSGAQKPYVMLRLVHLSIEAEPKCTETHLEKSQICPIWGQSDPIWMSNVARDFSD